MVNFKTEKNTQALSVYRKGTFHVYIKCLIVISWKVLIKRRGSEKGHTLAYLTGFYQESQNPLCLVVT